MANIAPTAPAEKGSQATRLSFAPSSIAAATVVTNTSGLIMYPGRPTVGSGLENQTETRVTSLPSNPFDGQQVFYAAGSSGELWHLRYNAASGSNFKWEYVGGSFLTSYNTQSQTASSTSFAALASSVASVTAPLAGDYEVELQMTGFTSVANAEVVMSVAKGATAAADADAVWMHTAAANATMSTARIVRLNDVSASSVLAARFRRSSAVSADYTITRHSVLIRPVRVG